MWGYSPQSDVQCARLTEVIQELGNSLNTDAKSIFRLIHEGAKVPEITGKQVGSPTSQCCLEYRLVLLRKALREGKVSVMLNKTDAVLKCAKII